MRGIFNTYQAIILATHGSEAETMERLFLSGDFKKLKSTDNYVHREHECREITSKLASSPETKYKKGSYLFFSSLKFGNRLRTVSYTSGVGKLLLDALLKVYAAGAAKYGGTYEYQVLPKSIRFVTCGRKGELSVAMVSTVLGILRNRKLWGKLLSYLAESGADSSNVLVLTRDYLFEEARLGMLKNLEFRIATREYLELLRSGRKASAPSYPTAIYSVDNLYPADLIAFAYMIHLFLVLDDDSLASALFNSVTSSANGPKSYFNAGDSFREELYKLANIPKVFGSRMKELVEAYNKSHEVGDSSLRIFILEVWKRYNAVPL